VSPDVDILIVNDDMVTVTMLKKLLEKLPGCNVKEFARPVLALAWCKHNEADLIIVNHLMPGLSGVEFARELRKFHERKGIPLIMVTATDEPELRASALDAGIEGILIKPFSFAQLQPLASGMLARRAAYTKERDRIAGGRRRTLLDMSMTLERLAGDQTLLSNIALAFMRTAPQLLTAISSALAANDLKRAFAETHALKGVVAAFEAPIVFNCVLNLEKHTKNSDGPAAGAAFRLTQDLVSRLFNEVLPLVPPGAELN
jgi:DNA-binding response OmpR family regulator